MPIPEPTNIRRHARTTVTIHWRTGGPRFWNPDAPSQAQAERAHDISTRHHGAKRSMPTHIAEWERLTVSASWPIATMDEVRLTGRGWYLRKDGSLGRRSAVMDFGRLDSLHKTEPELAVWLFDQIQEAEPGLWGVTER